MREHEARRRQLEERRVSDGATEHILSEKYESLDYEIVENELYRAAEKDKQHQACAGFDLKLNLIIFSENYFARPWIGGSFAF